MHKQRPWSVLLASSVLALAACSSGSSDSEDVADSGDVPNAAAGAGSGGGGDFPAISNRTYTGGSAQIAVGGFFTMDAKTDLNKPASISDDGHTWLQYGDSGAEAANATITFHDGESGVIVAQGSFTATGGGEQCKTKTDVTDATVAGHFSCTGVTGYDKATGNMGNVTIEIRFKADS